MKNFAASAGGSADDHVKAASRSSQDGWRTVRYHAYPIVKLGIAGAGDANRTRDPNLGKVMLYP